ncbi:MAG: hypothetical protein ACI9S9_002909, partial [Planctomycetota bacterium]
EHEGPTVRDRVIADLQKLRAACSTVDAGALRAQHAEDLDAFRAALHEARARAIKSSGK